MDRLFLELIHVALGRREELGHAPSADEWADLYREAVRQTMAAVLFAGISRLPAEQRPPRTLLLQWFALTERTREMNRRMNSETVRVCGELERAGFGVVVLKGQGVATGYPDPSLRQPGDIDAWVVRDGGKDFPRGNFRAVTDHARRLDPQASVQLLHTDFRLSALTEVEAHFWPSYFFSPLHQHRLRRWATRRLPEQLAHRTRLTGTDGDVCTPTAEFNTVFLLLHIYRHLFHEGIGLRQLLDYHYCLSSPELTSEGRETACRTLHRLGLWRFARAVSYVLATVFLTEADRLPAPPDVREGRFLLREIMLAGNFGHHDRRQEYSKGGGPANRYLSHLRGNLRLMLHYPEEALCAPFFRTWHYLWRKWNGFA